MNSFGLGVVLKFTDNFSMGVGTATTAFNGLSQAIDSQASGITNTLTSLCSTASSIGSQLTAAITTPVASIAGTFLQYGVARASFVENSTLAFSTLMGDTKQASAYLQELMDFAKTTPFTYETLTSVAQQFMAYGADMDSVLKSLNEDGTEFGGILQALGDAAGGLGQGESFVAEISDALVKMKTDIDSGTSTTVRLQQLESRGLQVSRILGNMWNVEGASASTISEYIKKNNISYTEFLNSLTEGIEKGTDGINGTTAAMGGLMANIKNTWTGALDTWKSSLKTAGKNLMDYNEDTGTYGFLTDMTKALNICSNAVKTFSPLLQPLVDDIRNMMVKGSSYLEELTKKWEKTPQETKDKIAKLVEVLVLLGPALLTVGKAGGAVSSVFGSFGGTLSKSLKFAFSPVGVLTGLLSGLAGAFIYLWQTNDEFKEHIKSTFSGILESWGESSKSIKQALGRVGEAFLDLFKNVTELLAPAFKGIFDTVGDSNTTVISVLINLLNGLASAIQWVSDKVEVLNKKWNELPKSTQDKISGIVGKITLLALGFVGLFKVFKSLKSASAIIDNIPFIGKKSKIGGSSGGLSGGLLTNPKKVVKAMGSIAIILGGAVLIIDAIGLIQSIPGFSGFLTTGTQTLNQLFTTLHVFTTLEFWGLCVAVAALGALSLPLVCDGIVGLAAVIGAMALIVSAFGVLALIPGINDFMEGGGELLATIFEQVGKAVGALIGGFAEGITQALPGIAENLSQFGEKIQPFFNSLNNVPTASAGEFLIRFAEFMLMMTADQILSFFTGGLDFVGMGEGLSSFGNSAKSFFDAVSAYPEEGIKKASLVFQALQGMGNYDFKTGGLFQAFTGTTDMEEMGRQLSLFAPNAFKFFMYCVMYPIAGLKKAPKVFEALNGMGSYDFKTWGLAQLFTGTTDLAEMGRQLASFAPNAFIFFKVAGLLSFKEITRGKQILETLTLIGDYDNKTWGLAQLFSGSTDIRTTGEQLADFAPNAYKFFKVAGLLNFKEIAMGRLVLQTLTLLGDYDNKTWGLAQLFSGSTDIRGIGNQLKDFAPNAKEYYTSMGELSLEQIRRGRLVLENLALTGDYNNKTWGLAQLFTGSTDLRTLGQQLADFAPNAKTFYTELGAIDNYLFPRGREALEIIGTISDISNRSGGIAQAFTGNLALDTLGTQLASFGKDIKTYLLYVGQTSDKGIEKTPKVIESLAKVDTLTSIAHTNDKERLSSLGSGLSLFMINGDTFFSRASDISTSNSIVTLSKHLKTFLGVVSKFNVDALQTLINKINALNKTAYKFNATLGNVSVAVRNNTNIIRNSIVSSVNSSIYVLNQFADSGSVIGHNLMVSIANGIYSNAWQIQRAVQYAVDSMQISMPNISSKVTNTAKVNMPHLASGGLATSPTVALIGEGKDDEGVFPLNDDTFKRLARGIVSQTATTNNVSNSGDKNSYDYSVTFEAGSIQFNLTGASDADLEQAAEKIEKIILRRQEIRKMANR